MATTANVASSKNGGSSFGPGAIIMTALIAVSLGLSIVGYGLYFDSAMFAKRLTETKKHKNFKPVAERKAPVVASAVVPATTSTAVSPAASKLAIGVDRTKLVRWVKQHSLKGKMYDRLAEEIVDSCLKAANGKHALLLLSLIRRESNFYIFHRSGAGAVGLGQFMPDTIDQCIKEGLFKDKSDVYDPRKHIPAILFVLNKKGFGDGKHVNKALFNYFGGSLNPDMAQKYIRDIKTFVGELVLMLSEGIDDKEEEVRNNAKNKS